MNKYLIVGALCSEIINAKSATEALAEYWTKSTDIIKDLIFWESEDVRQYLLRNNFTTLTHTRHKEVFTIN